jgi:hypothetical protein
MHMMKWEWISQTAAACLVVNFHGSAVVHFIKIAHHQSQKSAILEMRNQSEL